MSSGRDSRRLPRTDGDKVPRNDAARREPARRGHGYSSDQADREGARPIDRPRAELLLAEGSQGGRGQAAQSPRHRDGRDCPDALEAFDADWGRRSGSFSSEDDADKLIHLAVQGAEKPPGQSEGN